ncbi:hypothetical protein JCM33374_g6147 [Metschnikowia sp. JCM 33374]|nr:hypothetical protein JCM33374_g6147 [Metschnikowia sp. JCM 33374]
MSASKIMEQIRRKAKLARPPQNTHKVGLSTASAASSSRPSSLASQSPHSGERVVDPVVARLKAARKAEREQKEREAREKKGLPPKKESNSRPKSSSNVPRNASKSPGPGQGARGGVNGINRAKNGPGKRGSAPMVPHAQRHSQSGQGEKKPKMSFTQLMAKASGIDQSKMSIAIKQKTKSPEAASPGARRRTPDAKTGLPSAQKRPPLSASASGPSSARPTSSSAARRPVPPSRNKPEVAVQPPASHSIPSRAPLPMRKPSSALAAKLKQKPGAGSRNSRTKDVHQVDDDEDDESDDMDSFIASEDEEELEAEPEYDRDEIWSIFNRGKKRSHYAYDDYDSDDMEATGAEILEEESRSKRNALLEDKREMEKEAKLAALKRARKSGNARH